MTSLLIGCGNLGKIILEGFIKKKKKISVLEKINSSLLSDEQDSSKNTKIMYISFLIKLY